MGIYIKGKLPMNVAFEVWFYPSGVVAFYDSNGNSLGASKWKELPPHGRLIDADALKIYQMEENVREDGYPNEYEYDAGLIDGLHMAAKAVSVAPTVIPADPEKEDE
jgi:hypothetical protein